MRKIIVTILVLVLGTGFLFAQQPPAAEGGQPATAPKPSVSTPLGELQIDGRVIVGGQAQWYNKYNEDYSTLAGYNAEMGESRAELSFHLKNGNFGEFLMLRAQNFSPNMGYLNGNYNPNNNTLGNGFGASFAYWFVYENFFDNKFKVSVGKLYDENFVTRERVWKTEGSTKGGFYFSRDGYASIRFEVMPIQGLDVGAQLFFVNPNASYIMNLASSGMMNPDATDASVTESLKEWGLGVSYTSSFFNTQAGIRLDSAVDPMNKYEGLSYTKLKDYYGDEGNLDPTSGAGMSRGVHFKHMDKLTQTISGTVYPKAFSDGTYAFFGFNLKAVKNLTFKVQGQFNNIPAFEEFGYGIFDETIGYQVLPKLSVGIVMFQEFHGGDVFDETQYVNSPFFRFQPTVSYQITPKIKGTLEGTVGFCEGVLDTPYISIKPKFDFAIAAYGAWRAQIFYEFERAEYKDAPAKTHDKDSVTKHTVGLGVDFVF
jgi:hypothetical protein